MLWLYRRVAFGIAASEETANLSDMSAREWTLLAPIAAAVLWMGVYPESFLAPMRRDVALLQARLAPYKADGDANLLAGPAPHAASHNVQEGGH
jgi:NADH-quinone oxidoreductase subunit M